MSKEPEPSNLSFSLLLIATAILSFVFGSLTTTIYFILTRPKVEKESAVNEFNREFGNHRASIKQCPKCNSTYTDEDLKYCLRDGLTLKIVGSLPLPPDRDKTEEFRG